MNRSRKYIRKDFHVIDLYKDGYNMPAIATETGIELERINNILISYTEGRYDTSDQFVFLFESGRTLEEISLELDKEMSEIIQLRDQYICKRYDYGSACDRIARELGCPLDQIVSIICAHIGIGKIPKIYSSADPINYHETEKDKLDKIIGLLSILLSRLHKVL